MHRTPNLRLPEGFSFHIKKENRATKMGVVLTRVAELATEVREREEIQKMKWKARKTPEIIDTTVSWVFHGNGLERCVQAW